MKNKILESGIFKLDENGEPIGITNLIPGQGIKNLSKGNIKGEKGESKSHYTPYDNMPKMIDELAYELGNWHKKSELTDDTLDLFSRLNERLRSPGWITVGSFSLESISTGC